MALLLLAVACTNSDAGFEAGTALCVVDIAAPNTLQVRAGPGDEHDVIAELNADACMARSAAVAVDGWQPVTVFLAELDLRVVDGFVSTANIADASQTDGPEAAVAVWAAGNPAVENVEQRSTEAGGWLLTQEPDGQRCETFGTDQAVCSVDYWIWSPAPHPCSSHDSGYLRPAVKDSVMVEAGDDGTWQVGQPAHLVIGDC